MTYLRQKTKIFGVVSMPEALFKTSGKGGTHAKVCVVFIEKTPPTPGEDYDIFMADAKWCGHDSMGLPTIRKNKEGEPILLDDVPVITQNYRQVQKTKQPASPAHLGFLFSSEKLHSSVYIPKFYDPAIRHDLSGCSSTQNLVSLSDLVAQEVLSFATGIEVGKMAYGMGSVPFIRTSDISNWELRADPKQNVSEELYEETRAALDVQAEDIFVVRDGTYLVGTSCILTEHDTKILYCGGLYKVRVHKKEVLDPYLLLALLNTPIVRRQMKAKQFTRDVIDTLGKRLFEVVLPIPKSADKCRQIAKEVRELIETRVGLRNRTKEIALEVQGIERLSEEDAEVLEEI